jgi:hypothetical protein
VSRDDDNKGKNLEKLTVILNLGNAGAMAKHHIDLKYTSRQ